jgi:hypothetical protein
MISMNGDAFLGDFNSVSAFGTGGREVSTTVNYLPPDFGLMNYKVNGRIDFVMLAAMLLECIGEWDTSRPMTMRQLKQWTCPPRWAALADIYSRLVDLAEIPMSVAIAATPEDGKQPLSSTDGDDIGDFNLFS